MVSGQNDFFSLGGVVEVYYDGPVSKFCSDENEDYRGSIRVHFLMILKGGYGVPCSDVVLFDFLLYSPPVVYYRFKLEGKIYLIESNLSDGLNWNGDRIGKDPPRRHVFLLLL